MNKFHLSTGLSTLLFVICLYGCSEGPLFRPVPASRTGIHFSNDITTTDSFNAVFYEYIYNGGGVAAGDVNGDGLTDLFFTGNQVSNRLYLNRGNLRFEDVTEASGLLSDRWCTGVAMADINDDGRLDIYVSVAGFETPPEEMANMLFINQGWKDDGIPSFSEEAAAYGLDDRGYSTQGAFFDYDLDGDLDLYLLTNAMESFNRNTLRPKRVNGEAPSTDRLYRNSGDGTFTNVSREAGILIEGYGLGVQISDLNFDGYPDVYAANDFLSNDLVWINNGNGTFTNRAGEYLKHQTHNGMGADIADINNDALPDIAVLDMLPYDNYRQKIMLPNSNVDFFYMKKEADYQDQYMRNTLQLHRGFQPDGAPRFSEIGFQAGIAGTDWSWSVLFADYDLDGWKDVFITNGYRKDVTNLDYINYSNANQLFGTHKAKRQKAIEDLENAPDVEVSNFLFRNNGNLSFTDVSEASGINQPSFSNGAVYTDLDQDGDLDLVVNNIDAKAFIYENRARQRKPEQNFLQVQLLENSPDVVAFNTKVWVYHDGQSQYQEYSPFRGYKSTVESALHFGLGSTTHVDSVVVQWLDGRVNKQVNLPANQKITVRYLDNSGHRNIQHPARNRTNLLQSVEESSGLQFMHGSHYYSDFNIIRTLPHEHSKTGPPLATGDINGDGLTDCFVGGNIDQAGVCFVQNQEGDFTARLFPFDRHYKDAATLLFDADGDGDQDLYVGSGGTHRPAEDTIYQDRLYLNDGNGNFAKASEALPILTASTGCVKAADYDLDGDLDLFVGGRIQPNEYPLPPRSYLLRNEGGRFVDATPEELQNPGLVTDAAWTDWSDDGRPDLVLVGEWMPVTFFENQKGRLRPVEPEINTTEGNTMPTEGWWFHLNAHDLDGDGDQDFLLGNLGLNSKLCATPDEPVQVIAKDFDQNGTIDPLLACFLQGEQYIMHQRDLLIDQIPAMKRRFPDYDKYAEANIEQTLSEKDFKDAYIRSSYTFASGFLENMGTGRFRFRQLPPQCQMSPIMGSVILDINQDGLPDILSAGNFHAAETTQLGWQDASYGNILINKGNMQFEAVNPLAAGFIMDGDVRSLAQLLAGADKILILGGVYNGELKVFRMNSQQPEL